MNFTMKNGRHIAVSKIQKRMAVLEIELQSHLKSENIQYVLLNSKIDQKSNIFYIAMSHRGRTTILHYKSETFELTKYLDNNEDKNLYVLIKAVVTMMIDIGDEKYLEEKTINEQARDVDEKSSHSIEESKYSDEETIPRDSQSRQNIAARSKINEEQHEVCSTT